MRESIRLGFAKLVPLANTLSPLHLYTVSCHVRAQPTYLAGMAYPNHVIRPPTTSVSAFAPTRVHSIADIDLETILCLKLMVPSGLVGARACAPLPVARVPASGCEASPWRSWLLMVQLSGCSSTLSAGSRLELSCKCWSAPVWRASS